MPGPLHHLAALRTRIVESRALLYAVQTVIVVSLLLAYLFFTGRTDALTEEVAEGRARDAEQEQTLALIGAMLADTCGAASMKALRQQGLLEECRLARAGDLGTVEVPTNDGDLSDPDSVDPDVVPDPSGPVVVPDAAVDAAVARWMAAHPLGLDPGVADTLERVVADTVTRGRRGVDGADGQDGVDGVDGATPTDDDIRAAVAAVLIADPPPAGADGRGIAAASLDGCQIVFTMTDGTTETITLCDTTSLAPARDAVAAAVADYCATTGDCVGPVGPAGPAGDTGPAGYPDRIDLTDGQTCTDPDGDHVYTCRDTAPTGP